MNNVSNSNNRSKKLDLIDAIWRPFTQEKTSRKPLKVVRGDGLYLYTEDGRRYADMISSWWVNIHGHANEEIAEAIAQQAAKLEQVIFTTFCHQPSLDLVQRLQRSLPYSLCRFFFSDNGSTSVEVALKMAYQFFKNKNGCNKNSNYNKNLDDAKRAKYLHLEGAYHGDTFGAMSVSGKNSIYHFNFSKLFFDAVAVEVPEFYEGVPLQNIEQQENRIIYDLDRRLELHGDEFCALIVEPLLQGARGMVVYRPEFLEKLVKTVRKYGILVIFDEVFTGFYRTGRFFAMDYIKTKPDIVCISKAITGGFLPLALTVTTNEIYAAFLSDDFGQSLIHGHSYTGNPIACAAACKSLELLERPETIKHIKEVEKFYKDNSLSSLKKLPKNTIKQRNMGIMMAFNLPSEKIAGRISEELFGKKIFIRPLGKTLYLLPPYCIKLDELEWVYAELDRCIENL